jgi:hypothetical protein
VCQDAGKSENEYRSHFTRESRDANSKITCPTLLALECRFCYKNGHTLKYCPTLKERDSQKNKDRSTTRHAEPKQVETKNVKKSNAFACLDCDSEEEKEEKVVNVKEEFPQLCAPVKQVQPTNSYAAALASEVKSVVIPIPSKIMETCGPKLAPWESRSETKGSVPVPYWKPMKNWADDSDSEEEGEYAPITYKPLQNSREVYHNYDDEDW